jgi:hypothetical protein
MPLNYVLDEHLRGILWGAIQRHNGGGQYLIDVVRVGDPADLPLGTLDPDILIWAEKENRVVVTNDRNTMLGHLAAHLQAGHHCAGLFILRPHAPIPQIIDYLVLSAHTTDPALLRDHYDFIP